MNISEDHRVISQDDRCTVIIIEGIVYLQIDHQHNESIEMYFYHDSALGRMNILQAKKIVDRAAELYEKYKTEE